MSGTPNTLGPREAPRDHDADRSTTGDRPEPTRPPRFQFTISQMIVLTTVVAIFCAATFAVPTWLSIMLANCFGLLVPMVLTVVLVYGHGYERTFCIGALFPAGFMGWQQFGPFAYHFIFTDFFPRNIDADAQLKVWLFLLGVLAVSGIFGVGAMGVRWTIESRRQRKEREAGRASEPPPDVLADE